MLVDRDTLGTCFPFPSPFPGTISFGSFSDSGISPFGAECHLGFQQFSISGKSGLPGKSGSGCHSFSIDNGSICFGKQESRILSGTSSGFFFFLLSLVTGSKVALAAKYYQFQIPGTKHVDMFSQVHSQPAN